MFLKRRLPLINYSLCLYRTDKAPEFHILHTLTALDCISARDGKILQQSYLPGKEHRFPWGQGLGKAETSVGGPVGRRVGVEGSVKIQLRFRVQSCHSFALVTGAKSILEGRCLWFFLDSLSLT